MDGTTEISGTYTLERPVWLPFNGVLVEVTGFNWTAPIEHMTNSTKVDLGDRIVDLILRSVQLPDSAQLSDAITAELARRPERIFTRDQIILWTLGQDGVIKAADK